MIGGGPLGCEMAQAFARLGSRVTLLQRDARLLPRDDPQAAALLLRVFEAENVRVRLDAAVERVTLLEGAGKRIAFTAGGVRDAIDVDAILVATGRAPDLSGLNLRAAGVRSVARGIEVDDFLRTSNRRVFAAGDACLAEKFTHAADASARLAVQNALIFPFNRWSRQVVPHVTYTEPEIAQIGLTEAAAGRHGSALETYGISLSEIDRAVTDADADGFVKVIAARRSGRILGATIVATHAGEMIGHVATAISARLTLKDLSKAIFPYPTESEALKKIADQHLTRSLTGWKRWLLTRLTAR